jgi:hypothetical protein
MIVAMMIHLRLSPLDRELPSLTEIRARRQLGERLLEWVGGELDEDGDDYWLEVEKVDEALPLVEQVLAELALEHLATIEVVGV